VASIGATRCATSDPTPMKPGNAGGGKWNARRFLYQLMSEKLV
jgi:hypothetical protein